MQKNSSLEKRFSELLLRWNKDQNRRVMPWKGEKDPYKIWLSEIILQQTRVAQGLEYYNNFINTFPDVNKLAGAPKEKVFKLWEGLGYYTRCRNLIATAEFISRDCDGKFPDNYEGIKSLKGVGPYTAAAISSFAFNLPHAVLDGNVFRVLSRLFGIEIPIDTNEGKKYFSRLADKLLDKQQPGSYNQAIMDFGANICKPAAPLCHQCVFNKYCQARLTNKINELPVKEKKITIRKRWFYYLQMEYKNEVLIRQRTGKDIWQQLFEFPMIESSAPLEQSVVVKHARKNGWLPEKGHELISLSPLIKQQLSHQLISGQFIKMQVKQKLAHDNLIWVKKQQLKDYAFPRIINRYLESM